MNERATDDKVGGKRQRSSMERPERQLCPESVDLMERMWVHDPVERPIADDDVAELEILNLLPPPPRVLPHIFRAYRGRGLRILGKYFLDCIPFEHPHPRTDAIGYQVVTHDARPVPIVVSIFESPLIVLFSFFPLRSSLLRFPSLSGWTMNLLVSIANLILFITKMHTNINVSYLHDPTVQCYNLHILRRGIKWPPPTRRTRCSPLTSSRCRSRN
jgi:hypothetical protein